MFPVANDSHSLAKHSFFRDSSPRSGLTQSDVRHASARIIRADNAQCELEAAMTAVAEAACVFSDWCENARRMELMTAYPQAMPKIREQMMVIRTVEEAIRVRIWVRYSKLRCCF